METSHIKKQNQTVFNRSLVNIREPSCCECSYSKPELLTQSCIITKIKFSDKASVYCFFICLKSRVKLWLLCVVPTICVMLLLAWPQNHRTQARPSHFPFLSRLWTQILAASCHADDGWHSKSVTERSLRSEARVSSSYSFTLFLH